jgi:hypothetical protein
MCDGSQGTHGNDGNLKSVSCRYDYDLARNAPSSSTNNFCHRDLMVRVCRSTTAQAAASGQFAMRTPRALAEPHYEEAGEQAYSCGFA